MPARPLERGARCRGVPRQAGRRSPSRTAGTIRRHRRHQAAGASSSAGWTRAPHAPQRQMAGDSDPSWKVNFAPCRPVASSSPGGAPRGPDPARPILQVATLCALRNGHTSRPWRAPRTRSRRWTGIEPAGRGSPAPPALKAGRPTRCLDTSVPERRGAAPPSAPGPRRRPNVALPPDEALGCSRARCSNRRREQPACARCSGIAMVRVRIASPDAQHAAVPSHNRRGTTNADHRGALDDRPSGGTAGRRALSCAR